MKLTAIQLEKVVAKIKALTVQVRATEKQLNRQKFELAKEVYIYAQAVHTRDPNISITDALRSLTKKAGKSYDTWRKYYNSAELATKHKLNANTCKFAAVKIVANRKKITEDQHHDIMKKLKSGASCTEIDRTFVNMGYKPQLSNVRYQDRVSSGYKPFERLLGERAARKKSWSHWKHELWQIAREIARTSDGHHQVDLLVIIDKEHEIAVQYKS